MKLVKFLCGFGFLLVLASNIWTISRWNESRGVYDDICYLRQAHLFKQFGLDGLNTDIKRDDVGLAIDGLEVLRNETAWGCLAPVEMDEFHTIGDSVVHIGGD
jgi:hypothetical protein